MRRHSLRVLVVNEPSSEYTKKAALPDRISPVLWV